MSFTLEYVERIFRENNLLDGSNTYFYAKVMPGLITQAFWGPILSTLETCNYLVTICNNNLILVPCNYFDNQANLSKIISIPLVNISKINIDKGNPGFIKLSLLSNNEVAIELQFTTSDLSNVNFKNNVLNFVNFFNHNETDLLTHNYKNISKPGLIILMLLFVFGAIFMFVDGNIMYGVLMVFFALVVLFTMIIKRK